MEVFRVGSQPSAAVPGLLHSLGWMLTFASCSVTDPSKPFLLRNAPLTVQPLPCTTCIRIKLANCSPIRPITKTLLRTFLCLHYAWKTWGFCFKNAWWAQWTYFSWCSHKSSLLLFHILNVHYDWWRRFSELFLVECLSTGSGALREILLEKPLVVSVSAKCSGLIICHLKIILYLYIVITI